MASVNKVILVGRVAKTPVVRHTPTGVIVTNFTMATSEKKKNQDGSYGYVTEWHNIVCWNKLGEIAGQYVNKGKEVYIEGKIQCRKSEGKDGRQYTNYDIICTSMQLLGKKDDEKPAFGGLGGLNEKPEEQPSELFPVESPVSTIPREPGADDDVPF